MNIALQITNRVQKLIEIRVMKLHSCRLQYNWIDQTCDHNQDSIEICSAQQAGTGRELLYTETDFSEHTCWWTLTGSRPHAGSHVDNVALLIMLLCWLAGNFISVLNSRLNLELLVECSVTSLSLSFILFSFLSCFWFIILLITSNYHCRAQNITYQLFKKNV